MNGFDQFRGRKVWRLWRLSLLFCCWGGCWFSSFWRLFWYRSPEWKRSTSRSPRYRACTPNEHRSWFHSTRIRISPIFSKMASVSTYILNRANQFDFGRKFSVEIENPFLKQLKYLRPGNRRSSDDSRVTGCQGLELRLTLNGSFFWAR